MAAQKPVSNKAVKTSDGRNITKLVVGGLMVLLGAWLVWQGYFGGSNDQIMPGVRVSSWLNKSKPVIGGASAKVYDVKQNYSDTFVRKFAENLIGVAKIDRKDDVAYGYKFGVDASSVDTAYTFNSKTGSFSFIGRKQLTGNEKLETRVNKFVQTLVPDLSIGSSSSYKRRDKPGMIFVELHRDWQAVGLPILSSLGLLNLSESKSLSDLSLAASSNGVRNENIFATTDNSDRFARQTDFNTITVGLNESDNSLVSMVSNIRQLENNTSKNVKLMSYDQATKILTANKYKFLHTTPVGDGVPAYDKVYPSQNVEIRQAVITDSTLAYLEEIPGVEQSRLEPYYVFRGSATLASGYDVRFVAGVPATKQARSFSLSRLWNTETAMAVDGPGGSGGTVTPVNPPPPPVVDECIPAVSDLTNIRPVGPDIKIGQLTPAGANKVRSTLDKRFVDLAAKAGDWYVFPVKAQLTAQDIVDAMAAAKAADPSVTTRSTLTVQSLLTRFNRQTCPNRITGQSPTIFIYGAAGSAVSVRPGAEVTYANPGLQQGEWKAVLGYEGLLVNGLRRPYIYYEYQHVGFVAPDAGWAVKKNELPELTRLLGIQLRLNKLETDRLLFELRNAAASIESEDIFVGPLDSEQVSNKLPLKVDGSSVLERRHFYVSKAEKAIYKNPRLAPIQRVESMVLELGAVAGR